MVLCKRSSNSKIPLPVINWEISIQDVKAIDMMSTRQNDLFYDESTVIVRLTVQTLTY